MRERVLSISRIGIEASLSLRCATCSGPTSDVHLPPVEARAWCDTLPIFGLKHLYLRFVNIIGHTVVCEGHPSPQPRKFAQRTDGSLCSGQV
jgi:hypothetical protein